MPTTIRCEDCDTATLGTSHGPPRPFDGDECRECGCTEFYRPGADGDDAPSDSP